LERKGREARMVRQAHHERSSWACRRMRALRSTSSWQPIDVDRDSGRC